MRRSEPNRLIHETSPYLRQHAYNPVDWYPWGAEALEKARVEGKPVFASIGYAACHWCHVMERESFEDEDTARFLNTHFVPVKVDREERPDLDGIYMGAVVAMTGRGGWPMSVFLTPDGKPFYGGTYFPDVPKFGMPSFNEVLRAVAEVWRNRRGWVLECGSRITESIRENSRASVGPPAMDSRFLAQALRGLQETFDPARGGFGGAPKFPQPMPLEFLMRAHARTGDSGILAMIARTLDAMARGGLFDHLGGGFHRYCVDESWRIPHFEKMLYDNAQLARTYLHAWQITGNGLYRGIAERTLDYVLREMTHPAGGFFSSQDADSEGREGRFYVWSIEEVRAALGHDGMLFADAYGMSPGGNFEGKNVLLAACGTEELARRHGLPPEEVGARLEENRRKLLEVRERRERPARDEKILAGWNGLMLASFAEAARAWNRTDYRKAAEKNAAFLLRNLRGPDGRVLRSWKEGEARLNGYLEDYANLAHGLLALYQTTFDTGCFVAARELADTILSRFSDPSGGFFDTSDDHEELICRPKDLADNAIPSGSAMAATVLLELGAYTGEKRYAEEAEQALCAVLDRASGFPSMHAQWLCALEFGLGPRREVAILGEGQDAADLISVARSGFLPDQVVAAGKADRESPVPLLRGHAPVEGRASAYVCRNQACEQPVNEPEALARLLRRRGEEQ
ncbi:MAG: thioredoxin domain-containing protein [Candidatus Deferrimicrobiota bacterium]